MIPSIGAATWLSAGVSDLTGPVAAWVAGIAFLAFFFSNRLQRQVRGTLAHAVYRTGIAGRGKKELAALERAGSVREFFEALPWVTCRAAGVSPVTLFILDGSRYVPAHSTRPVVEAAPVEPEEPLAAIMFHSRRVHDLHGRADDLENAPIYAVNDHHLRDCSAVCAVPLRCRGTLYGFLLCGGSGDGQRLSLRSMARLEGLARIYGESLARYEVALLAAEIAARRTLPLEAEAGSAVAASPDVAPPTPLAALHPEVPRNGDTMHPSLELRDPRMAGARRGYEPKD